MPLESGDYISDLNASNPLGTGDPKSQGDDHFRLIKKTVKQTFPNLSGAVTPTHTELNYVDGVTSAIQDQLDGKAATVHVHSAADLTTGTIPDARFPSTLPALNGSLLTALNGSNIASGTVADARLSANVALLNAAIATSFSSASGTGLQATNSSAHASATAQLTLVNNSGNYVYLLKKSSGGGQNAVLGGNGSLEFNPGDVAGLTLAAGGLVTTPNASASEVGFKGMPVRLSGAADVTLALTDAGGCIVVSSASCNTVQLPAEGTVAFPIGTLITITVGAIADTVAFDTVSDTVTFLPAGLSGDRTLAANSVFTLLKVSSANWVAWGAGVS